MQSIVVTIPSTLSGTSIILSEQEIQTMEILYANIKLNILINITIVFEHEFISWNSDIIPFIA